MGARWYAPEVDTFISRDTIAETLRTPISLNRYTYAHADPIDYYDPDGHDPYWAWSKKQQKSLRSIRQRNIAAWVNATLARQARQFVARAAKGNPFLMAVAAMSAARKMQTAALARSHPRTAAFLNFALTVRRGSGLAPASAPTLIPTVQHVYDRSGWMQYQSKPGGIGPGAPRLQVVWVDSSKYNTKDALATVAALSASNCAQGQIGAPGSKRGYGSTALRNVCAGYAHVATNDPKVRKKLKNMGESDRVATAFASTAVLLGSGALLAGAMPRGQPAMSAAVPRNTPAATPRPQAATPHTTTRLPVSETWGNPRTLAGHFRNHGADFGARSAGDYARMSSEFFQQSQLRRLPTKIDADGVIRVYDPATNTFGAYNPSGTTRTFFTPKRGVDYWNDQPGAAPSGWGG